VAVAKMLLFLSQAINGQIPAVSGALPVIVSSPFWFVVPALNV
jgi:hypothetical protein